MDYQAELIVTSITKQYFVGYMLRQLACYDSYTLQHSVDVAKESLLFGEYLGLKKKELLELAYAGILHDVGKIMIPVNIILKTSGLSELEYAQIKMHPVMGANLIKKTDFFSNEVIAGVLNHHENYDGTGYPYGKKKDEISVYGQILRLTDSYDALVDNRPYRNGYSADKALAIIERGIGKEYSPDLCREFIIHKKNIDKRKI